MSAETLIVRGALTWGAVASVPATGLAWALRGPEGAISVAAAAALVLGNAGAAALFSAAAGRISAAAAAMVSLPSFGIRMMLMFLALTWLQGQPSIDRPVFALAFSLGVMVVIAMEARDWKRTPWLARTFGPAVETEDDA